MRRDGDMHIRRFGVRELVRGMNLISKLLDSHAYKRRP